METLFLELRYGLRRLTKSPGFSAIAVLTLALGIGASTAIFSVVYAVLLRPLPYPNPLKLVTVWEQTPNRRQVHLADPNFQDFRDENHTFSALAEYNYEPLSVAGGSEPVRVTASEVSQDFFEALGVEPFLGHSFEPEELRLNGARAAIVSYGYWNRYLAGSTDLSRFHLTMNGGVYSVIGVMPQGFDMPHGAALWIARDIDPYLPARTAHNWLCLGRVRDGVTVGQARGDLDAIAHRIHAEYGRKADLTDADVVPLADTLVGNVRMAVLMLFGAVVLLFLVACANVAGLLLARTSARRKEFSVRAALGAGRWRLVEQLLAESLPLALAGGLLGIALASWTTNLLPTILPESLPRKDAIQINATVLLFTLASTLIVAVGLGLFTAWRAGGVDLIDALSAGSRGYSSLSKKDRGALVVAEIAATMVMLAGAGLLGRSFLKLISVSPGFSGQNLMILKFSLPQSQSALTFGGLGDQEVAGRIRFLDDALARLQAVPGVQEAAVTGGLPVADEDGFPDGGFLILNGHPAPTSYEDWDRWNPKEMGHADYAGASEEYFRMLGVPLIRGRLFNSQDIPESQHVAVISETLARQQWPDEDPIGQVIDFGNMDTNLRPLTIVGVVGDVRAEGLDHPPSPIVYVNYRQRGLSLNTSPAIVLRTSLPASSIASSARDIFRALDPTVPVEFSTFEQALGGWLAERRFLLLLAGVFACAALALAAVGIYGLVAHSVVRRTQEIGVRMALGARHHDILSLILGEGARLAAIGLTIGIAASFVVTRVISSQLFGVKATDPLTFVVVAVLLSVVALLASYIPARRAMSLDPNTALRQE